MGNTRSVSKRLHTLTNNRTQHAILCPISNMTKQKNAFKRDVKPTYHFDLFILVRQIVTGNSLFQAIHDTREYISHIKPQSCLLNF